VAIQYALTGTRTDATSQESVLTRSGRNNKMRKQKNNTLCRLPEFTPEQTAKFFSLKASKQIKVAKICTTEVMALFWEMQGFVEGVIDKPIAEVIGKGK
jgi:hypothetical protein